MMTTRRKWVAGLFIALLVGIALYAIYEYSPTIFLWTIVGAVIGCFAIMTFGGSLIKRSDIETICNEDE